MKNPFHMELLGWLRLLRFVALWYGSWRVIDASLTAFAQLSAMPQTTVLTAIIGIITFLLTRGLVAYIEQEFFGQTTLYSAHGARTNSSRSSHTTPVYPANRQPGGGYCDCDECRAARAERGLAGDERYWNGEV